MKEQVSSILDERYYEIDHPTGLKIFVMPKAHYRSAYAVIGTKYGSIDNRFKRSDAAEYTQVPEGIAHFWSTSCLSPRSWTLSALCGHRCVCQCVYFL